MQLSHNEGQGNLDWQIVKIGHLLPLELKKIDLRNNFGMMFKLIKLEQLHRFMLKITYAVP